ncbi:MAG: mechanosensitive ion channel [Cyanobacteria bacterium HKST-UBA03]|nr:mechanosensitive ion channel [Cyanobacteria bacterium HKST-UBA03]
MSWRFNRHPNPLNRFALPMASVILLTSLLAGLVAGLVATAPRAEAQLLEIMNQTAPANQAGDTKQSEAEQASDKPIEAQIQELENKLLTAQRRKQAFMARESYESVQPLGISLSDYERKKFLLGLVAQTYEDHIDALKKLTSVKNRDKDVQQAMVSWQGFGQKPPYSIDWVDELRDEVHASQLKIQALGVQEDILHQDIESFKKSLHEAQAEFRQLSTQLKSAPNESIAEQIKWQQSLLAVRIELSEAKLQGAVTEKQIIRDSRQLALDELTFQEKKLGVAVKASPLNKASLDEKLKANNQEKLQVNRRLDTVLQQDDQATGNLQSARKQLADYRNQLMKTDAEQTQAQRERLQTIENNFELRQAQLETVQVQVEMLRLSQTLLDYEAYSWKSRYELATNREKVDTADMYSKILRAMDKIEHFEPYFQSNLSHVNALIDQNQRIDSPHNKALVETYQEQAEAYVQVLNRLKQVKRLLERWKQELDEQRTELPLADQLHDKTHELMNWLESIWDFELFTVDEPVIINGQVITDHRGITLSNMLIAFSILILGMVVLRFSTKRFSALAISRFKWHPNRVVLFNKWLYYLMVAGLVLLAMGMADIPMTIFAFLGGALAIAAGFGARNLLNNFLSGIILLIERPVKLGDIVDVEGTRGTLERIGIRCSHVRRFDGIDILIPNGDLLEKNVINWTLSNRQLRGSLSVGVAYGSPTEAVRDILFEVVRDHPSTLPVPEPIVLFEDFADSALNFRVFYWLTVSSEMDMYITASDLRFEIEHRFRGAGITIAFPQRDMHLDTSTPLQVTVHSGSLEHPPSTAVSLGKPGATKPSSSTSKNEAIPV